MKKHTSYRGQSIDMEMLKFQNQHAVAIGNASLNARGDKIGRGGTVIKTREELLAERERELQLPDISPEHQSHSVAPAMAPPEFVDEFNDAQFEIDAPVEPVESKRAPVKRAPKKTEE